MLSVSKLTQPLNEVLPGREVWLAGTDYCIEVMSHIILWWQLMEVMQTANTKSGTLPQHVSNYTWGKQSWKTHKYCDRKVCIICEQPFISLNRLLNLVAKSLLKCVIRFSISFPLYTFPNSCLQISCPLAYSVHISSKASVAADTLHSNSGFDLMYPKHIWNYGCVSLGESKVGF